MISYVSKYDFLQVVSCRYFDIIKFIFDIQYMFKFCLREFPARDNINSKSKQSRMIVVQTTVCYIRRPHAPILVPCVINELDASAGC